MEGLDRDTLFVALTRPQMLFGVSYGYLIVNAIVTTELFLVFKSVWVLSLAAAIHLAGWLGSLRDARFFDIWLTKVQRCPRVRNHKAWGCNSYRA